MPEEKRSSSLLAKALAIVILVVVGWLVLKFVIGLVSSIAFIVVAIVAVIAAIWAFRQF